MNSSHTEILPAHKGEMCRWRNNRYSDLPRKCPLPNTMRIDGMPLCDRHAELIMAEKCGRGVVIHREKTG